MKKWQLNIMIFTLLVSLSSAAKGNENEDTIWDDISIAVSTFNKYKKTFGSLFWTASGRKRFPNEVACEDIRGLNLTLRKLKVGLKRLDQRLLAIEEDWNKYKIDTDIINDMKLKVGEIKSGVRREKSLMMLPTVTEKSRCFRKGITL